MFSEKHNSWRVGLAALVVFVGCVVVKRAEVPRGWFLAGSKPSEFEAGVDSGQAYQGHRSAYLKSKQLSVDGFGTLMQQFTAEQYLGKRVRLSGLVKSQEVTEWAGLWLRVDKGKEMVAFDKSLARCQMHPSVRPELPRSTANPSWL